jgi:hypothetical protein
MTQYSLPPRYPWPVQALKPRTSELEAGPLFAVALGGGIGNARLRDDDRAARDYPIRF